ncbi:hypothetical protein DFH06DRAFT_1167286 [Mycena polygramma]|nr:hypothetical protein DFH06DRAFT_1167286 [Mycena polygramma]
MSSSAIPLKFPRLLTLFLAWAWSLISLAIGINAFVKSNRDKNRIKAQVPPPTDISINTNDVFAAGVVVTVISALILVLTTLYLAFLLLDHRRGRTTSPSSTSPFSTRPSISTRTLTVQYATLGFLAVWLFATQVAVSVFVAQRSARVSASINGVPLPGNVVKTVERALNAKTRYRDFGYLKLLAILPWFTFLFTLAAAITAFLAARRARSHAAPTTTDPAAADRHKTLPAEPKPAA